MFELFQNYSTLLKWFQHDDPLSDHSFTIFYACLTVPICVVGMTGAALSASIYLSRSFRHTSINLFLGALEISHFSLLLFFLPILWPDHYMPSWLYVSCILYFYPFALIFHCLSIWLLIPVTIERWIAVCRPLMVSSYCTRRRSKIVIACVVSISFLFNLSRFVDATVQWHNGSDTSADFHIVLQLQAYPSYVFWYKAVASTLVLYVLPLCLIAIFNTLIIRQIRLTRTIQSSLSGHQRCAQQIATMLVCVVLVFIVCYTLCLILNLLEVTHPTFLYNTFLGAMLVPINNGLVVLNASSSFFFYMRFSSRYRRHVQLMWASWFERKRYRWQKMTGRAVSHGILKISLSPIQSMPQFRSISHVVASASVSPTAESAPQYIQMARQQPVQPEFLHPTYQERVTQV